ncbi:MAG: hypothetical protein U0V73_08045 [Acidimicrobiia bacterium]
MSRSPPSSAATRLPQIAASASPKREARRWVLVGLGTVAVVATCLLVARLAYPFRRSVPAPAEVR